MKRTSLNIQALQYRIGDLEPKLKNPYKGKTQAFSVKLGLFGTIFGPFWDFVVIFTKMKEKTCKKGKKRCHDISHVKKYI